MRNTIYYSYTLTQSEQYHQLNYTLTHEQYHQLNYTLTQFEQDHQLNCCCPGSIAFKQHENESEKKKKSVWTAQ